MMRFTYQRDSAGTGYDIYLNGHWIGWSAGNMTDARNTAKDIQRSIEEAA